jgi:hypothetical protein
MRKILSLTSLTMLALAFTASSAVAQHVPPGNSSVDEYTENVPGAGGDTSSDHHEGGAGGGVGSSGGGGLSPQVADQLEASGSDGQAAAALAEGSTPESHGDRQHKPNHGDDAGSQGGNPAGPDSGGGIGTAVGHLVGGSDSGGMGIALPLILIGALAAAVLFLIVRKRSDGLRQRPDEPSSA